MGAAKNQEVNSKSAILGPTGGHFGFCRRCGVAGGEQVPPAPLGWYSNFQVTFKIKEIQFSNVHNKKWNYQDVLTNFLSSKSMVY